MESCVFVRLRLLTEFSFTIEPNKVYMKVGDHVEIAIFNIDMLLGEASMCLTKTKRAIKNLFNKSVCLFRPLKKDSLT